MGIFSFNWKVILIYLPSFFFLIPWISHLNIILFNLNIMDKPFKYYPHYFKYYPPYIFFYDFRVS